ncbi:autotransporter outer membrane beta-barrel domain-containing protein [uncultured Methylophaga sp.]|uniref:autotransporter outer membrane beta-barrel domain-containing protein n=1 Tax=uncultured Methylophaga sp. TaxID=285271 RepID=UPI00344B8C20
MGLGYACSDPESFSESGASAANLDVSSESLESTQSRTGLRFEQFLNSAENRSLVWHLNAAWPHEFGGHLIPEPVNGLFLRVFHELTAILRAKVSLIRDYHSATGPPIMSHCFFLHGYCQYVLQINASQRTETFIRNRFLHFFIVMFGSSGRYRDLG